MVVVAENLSTQAWTGTTAAIGMNAAALETLFGIGLTAVIGL